MTDYIAQHKITWPIVFSREPVWNPDYGISGIPTITLIAPDGTVRHSAPGFREADEINRIDALLDEFHLSQPKPEPQK